MMWALAFGAWGGFVHWGLCRQGTRTHKAEKGEKEHWTGSMERAELVSWQLLGPQKGSIWGLMGSLSGNETWFQFAVL